MTTFSVAFDRILLYRDQMEIAIAKIAKHLPCFMQPGRIFVARFFVAIFLLHPYHIFVASRQTVPQILIACLKVSQH